MPATSPALPGTVKPGRDEQRVRQRYLRMSKEALIERLIAAERTLAEQRERRLSQQDEALTWRLRAETAEVQLQDLQAKTSRQNHWSRIKLSCRSTEKVEGTGQIPYHFFGYLLAYSYLHRFLADFL